MESVIQKAIEGGYAFETKNQGWMKEVMFQLCVLDPSFWQALSKACGWYKEEQLVYLIPDGMNSTQASIYVEDNLGVPLKETKQGIVYSPYNKTGKGTWKHNALHFHELNLTEGFDKAVEWLTSLIGE